MKIRPLKTIATVAILALGFPAMAANPLPRSGDDFTVHGEVGAWTVYSDATSGTCLAERVDTEGNVMQMGTTKDNSFAYVGVFTPDDVTFERAQPIEIAVDGRIFVGEAKGVRSKTLGGGLSGGYIETNNPDLVNAIAEGRTLVAFPEKTGVFEIDLSGTKRAIEEVRACAAGLAS